MKALNNLWLIGHQFLNQIYHELPSIRHKAQTARQQVPYVYDFYNVSCFTPNLNSLVTDVLAKFVNCLVKALNDTVQLPRIILIIPDGDILRFIMRKDEDSAHILTMTALSLIINQMARALDAKKDNLKRCKPGLIQHSEPKIVWIKMIDQIGFRADDLLLREMFNNRLNDLLADRDGHFIMDVNAVMLDAGHLNRWGDLNAYGQQCFWSEVDRQLEKFDKKKITLKPAKEHVMEIQPEYRPTATITICNCDRDRDCDRGRERERNREHIRDCEHGH